MKYAIMNTQLWTENPPIYIASKNINYAKEDK